MFATIYRRLVLLLAMSTMFMISLKVVIFFFPDSNIWIKVILTFGLWSWAIQILDPIMPE